MNDTINRVIVPGTFDPITFGHIDVIRRARRIFPSVIVAVAESQGKNGVGTPLCSTSVWRWPARPSVIWTASRYCLSPACWSTLHVNRAGAVVKGLRAMTDFEYELQQATSTIAWIASWSPSLS